MQLCFIIFIKYLKVQIKLHLIININKYKIIKHFNTEKIKIKEPLDIQIEKRLIRLNLERGIKDDRVMVDLLSLWYMMSLNIQMYETLFDLYFRMLC